MKKLIVAMSILALMLTGCATNTGTGAAVGTAGGAAAGALAGQLIGRNTQSTLIGAGVGAAVGGLAGAGIGKMMDNQEAEMRQALAASEAAAVRREGNLLAITLRGDVTFDTNSAEVKPGLLSEMDRVAQVMVQYPQTRILVEGHTDSTGKLDYNNRLSLKRAESVKNLLVQRGVASSRIIANGYGPSQPVATNATAEGRRQNRRVEIKIDPAQQGTM